MLKKLIGLVLLLSCVVTASGYAAYRYYWKEFQQLELTFASAYLEVKPGTSVRQLCQQWQQQHLLSSAQCLQLKWFSVLHPELRQIKAGVYSVAPAKIMDVLALLRSGKVAQFSFRFEEGKTLAENLKKLSQAAYLELDVSDEASIRALVEWPADWGQLPASLEGLLFADTYFYTAHSKASQLVKRANRRLIEQIRQLWPVSPPLFGIDTPYQLLILASIIEKESGYEPEKPLIATVFLNRLQKNMLLQTDPTVIYGLGDRYQGDITRAHLKDPHAYNTYVHPGLPPGPITLVGLSSIQAVVKPEPSDVLYFVASGGGKHVFSRTLAEHNQAVRRYILDKKS